MPTRIVTINIINNVMQVSEKVTNVGYGLRWLNQQPNNETFIGMFSTNRHEVRVICF